MNRNMLRQHLLLLTPLYCFVQCRVEGMRRESRPVVAQAMKYMAGSTPDYGFAARKLQF
jgi:hypothetical protein